MTFRVLGITTRSVVQLSLPTHVSNLDEALGCDFIVPITLRVISSAKVRFTNAPFAEQKATMLRPSRLKSQPTGVVIFGKKNLRYTTGRMLVPKRSGFLAVFFFPLQHLCMECFVLGNRSAFLPVFKRGF